MSLLLNVAIISIDKSLVGANQLGDAVERHRKYGQLVNHLDIIVYTHRREKLALFKISPQVVGWPSNSIAKIFFFFDALKIFKKLYRRRKIDLVVCQDPFLLGLIGWYLKKKYQLKLQINFHGDFWQNNYWLREHWLNYIFWLISKFTVPQADILRVMSQGQKEKLIKAGIAADKITVIATPVDLDKYLNHRLVGDLNSQQKIILHVGRDDKVKDYPTLIKAFAQVAENYQNVVLYQIGADKYIKQAVSGLSPELKSKIFIKGIRPHNYLINMYYLADLVVLTSKSESFGKVLVEANACAKPVISTATTGAQEIIQDGYNGFLVPIGNAEKLAEKMLELLNHPTLAQRLGKNGQQLVKQKFADNTQKTVQLWQKLVNS